MQTCISCMDRATIGLCSPLVAAGGRIAQVHRLGQRFNDDQWIVDTGGACFSPALPLPDETCVVLLVAGTFICRFFLKLLPSNYSLINLHPGTRNAKKRFKNCQEDFFQNHSSFLSAPQCCPASRSASPRCLLLWKSSTTWFWRQSRTSSWPTMTLFFKQKKEIGAISDVDVYFISSSH